MCAINGIFAYGDRSPAVDRRELVRTRDHMAARGPDGNGLWLSPDRRIGLGHQRLAIIDPSPAAGQPMVGDNGNLIIVFNGEIYNFPAIRRSLIERGARFATRSDTEVLLNLYALRGSDMVRDLRGMFALAIYDRHRERLFLVRDAYGIKPLYYADDGHTFRFASQVKALQAGGGLGRAPSPAGRTGFYLFGSVPEPYTQWRDIRALPAGSCLTVVRGRTQRAPQTHHSIARTFAEAERNAKPLRYDAATATVRDAVADAVDAHLAGDAAVGVLLSAGLDSSAVAALTSSQSAALQTVTVSFEAFSGSDSDEAPAAARLGQMLGSSHISRVVTEAEFARDLPDILAAMDQPSIDGVNIWFAAKAAREAGLKVVLTGLGGDELFGGYASFRDLPRLVRLLSPFTDRPKFTGLADRVLGALPKIGRPAHPKFAGLARFGGSMAGAYLLKRGLFMPSELADVLEPELVRAGLEELDVIGHIEQVLDPRPHDPWLQVACLESSLYMRNQLLRDADWAGMAHGVEVRTPFADTHLLARMAPILAALRSHSPDTFKRPKALLADAVRDLLPPEFLTGPKLGFATPIAHWLATGGGDHRWRNYPALATPSCPWARRWAVSLSAA